MPIACPPSPAYAKWLSGARAQGIRIAHLTPAWAAHILLQLVALCLCILIVANTPESSPSTTKPAGGSEFDSFGHEEEVEVQPGHTTTLTSPSTAAPAAEKKPVIPVDEIPQVPADPVVVQMVAPQPLETEPQVPVEEIPQVSAGPLVKQQITQHARPWRQEIREALDTLQELSRNVTDNDLDIAVIWTQVTAVIGLLEAPDASDIGNREICPAACALLVKTLLSDNIQRCDVQALDLLVRCLTLGVTWTPEFRQMLDPALKAGIQIHLLELYAGSTTSDHREAALAYHAQLVALGCDTGEVEVPQLLAAYDIFKTHGYD